MLCALARGRPGLLRHARLVHTRDVRLWDFGSTVEHVYFPVTAALSVMMVLSDGRTAEFAMVGREGIVGSFAYLGLRRSPVRVTAQIEGEVFAIAVKSFCHEIDGSASAVKLLKRFFAYELRAAFQSGTCNLHHSLRQRASRWLMTAADRHGEDRFRMTQSMLAASLGVRRQSAAAHCVQMQQDGLISYQRSVVEILDRPLLARQACECYAAINAALADVTLLQGL